MAFPLIPVLVGAGIIGIIVASSKKSSAAPALPPPGEKSNTQIQEEARQHAQAEAQKAQLPAMDMAAVERAVQAAIAQASQQPSPDYAIAVAKQTAEAVAAQYTQNPAAAQAAVTAATDTIKQNLPPPSAAVQPVAAPPAMPVTPGAQTAYTAVSPGQPTGTPPPVTPSQGLAWPANVPVALKPATWSTLPLALQQAYLVAATANTAQAWSSLAYQLDQAGFKYLATEVRNRAAGITATSAPIPTAVIAEVAKVAPGISPQLATAAATVLRDSADPKQLDKASTMLKTAGYPQLAEQVQAKSDAVKVATATAEGVKVVEDIMKAPAPVTPATPASPLRVEGLKMAKQVAEIQAAYGGPKDPKARNAATAPVKAWQTLAKLTADGKFGPGTAVALAKAGVGGIPLVMYWPQGTTAKQVLAYRQKLLDVANSFQATEPALAAEIAKSAARERGQGGIVGAMPA